MNNRGYRLVDKSLCLIMRFAATANVWPSHGRCNAWMRELPGWKRNKRDWIFYHVTEFGPAYVTRGTSGILFIT